MLLEFEFEHQIGVELLGFRLHARHRELTRVVHRLGVERDLDDRVALPPGGAPALVADVVDAHAEHEAKRRVPSRDALVERLTREVGKEGHVAVVAPHRVRVLPLVGLHGSTVGVELATVGGNVVSEVHADDTICSEHVRLGLHAHHGALPHRVQRLRQVVELTVAVGAAVEAVRGDVVDGDPHDEAERLEAGGPRQQDLVGREVGRRQLPSLHLGEPSGGRLGKAEVVGRDEPWVIATCHDDSIQNMKQLICLAVPILTSYAWISIQF